ncbi:MAG: isoprenyl transferase [Anaerolineae bacterium]|nr:MAG: isoprenyl transferase [Anaerolineae bacterium]MCL4877558.1 isoprenyl transferase [Anaerolineae bacterium]
MDDLALNLPERIPYHLAIIMDGNGRWAKQHGKPRHFGHQAGTENLRRILRACSEFGIKILTIYAFSTENWRRPPAEVSFLMRILETVIDRELDDLHANGVQLRHIGHLEGLQDHIQRKIRQAVERTRNNDRLILNVAFNYGGRDEIVEAVRRIIRDGVSVEQVDETLMEYYLSTAGQPHPDLVVRTSGEVRVSNFLVWQAAYAEYYITPVFWPDFDRVELHKALHAFAARERRFGMVEPPEV